MTSGARTSAFLLVFLHLGLQLGLMFGGALMLPLTAALADETQVTGAPPGSDLDRFLKFQGLKMEDIEANRAGRVSPHQAAMVAANVKWNLGWSVPALGGLLGFTLMIAIVDYVQKKRFLMFIVPAIAVGIAVIAVVLYFVLRPPTDFTNKKVVTIEAPLELLWNSRTRGNYHVTVKGVMYHGYGPMSDNLQGLTLKFHVIREDNICVAIEPRD